MTATMVRQLFSGLRFLHTTAKLVNRDIEHKHFGSNDGKLCLFDFSTCVSLVDEPRLYGFAGKQRVGVQTASGSGLAL